MIKRIDHVEIVPRDFARSLAFYMDVLGFKEKMRQRIDRPPLAEIVFLALNDTMIELMDVSEPEPAPKTSYHEGYRMMALEVDDMDETIAYLRSKGIELTKGPMLTGRSKRAEIVDPDGLPIELRQW
jgi:glyoxylase I family protein